MCEFLFSILAAIGNLSLSISDVEPINMEIRCLNKSTLFVKQDNQKVMVQQKANLFSLQEYPGIGDRTDFCITAITKIPVSGPAGLSVPQSYCKGQGFWSLS